MDGDGDLGRWSELVPDVLGTIFQHLSFKEKLTVIPLVCKSWRIVLMGPYSWQDLDIDEWSRSCWPHCADWMIQMLIKWCGPVRKLCVSGLCSTDSFSLVAQNAGSLQMLRLQRSSLTDSITEHLASNLETLSILDLSYCRNISHRSIRMIGNNCKLLVKFCRNMDPLCNGDRKFINDEEAEAIAATMPKLKHLEMGCSFLRAETVIKVLSNCSHLEFFDLCGSDDKHLDNEQVKQMFPKVIIFTGYNRRLELFLLYLRHPDLFHAMFKTPFRPSGALLKMNPDA